MSLVVFVTVDVRLAQLLITRTPLIQSRTPSFAAVRNRYFPVAGAWTVPLQRTENLSLLTPGPGDLVDQPKLMLSLRCSAGAPDSVVLLKYWPRSPAPVGGGGGGGGGG